MRFTPRSDHVLTETFLLSSIMLWGKLIVALENLILVSCFNQVSLDDVSEYTLQLYIRMIFSLLTLMG